MNNQTTLVLGGTGKTGRRVAEKLQARGVKTRIASRSADLPFDWDDRSTWDAALEGVTAVYVSYAPDLAIPGAKDAIRAFVEKAVAHGVQRLVLLSGRGEEEAQDCERIIQEAGVEWTVVRASWFNQNFSEWVSSLAWFWTVRSRCPLPILQSRSLTSTTLPMFQWPRLLRRDTPMKSTRSPDPA